MWKDVGFFKDDNFLSLYSEYANKLICYNSNTHSDVTILYYS